MLEAYDVTGVGDQAQLLRMQLAGDPAKSYDVAVARNAELTTSLERDREDLPDVWRANRRRNRHEPVRLKLSFISARLDAQGSFAGSLSESTLITRPILSSEPRFARSVARIVNPT